MADEKTTPIVKIGSVKLTGWAAGGALLAILAAVACGIVWARPSPGMLASGLIWLGFIIYWSVRPQAGGTAKSEESARSRATHQRLLNLGLLLLFVPLPGLRWPILPAGVPRVPLGLGIQGAATMLHIWARAELGRNWSSAVMIQTSHQLVRTGPYRWVRHPIYTAILGLAAGTAIVSGQLHGLFGFATFALAYLRKLRLEEAILGATFGAEWDAYRAASWALIPGVF